MQDFYRRPALFPPLLQRQTFSSTSGSFVPVLRVVLDGGLLWSLLSQAPPLQPAEALCSAASRLTGAERRKKKKKKVALS